MEEFTTPETPVKEPEKKRINWLLPLNMLLMLAVVVLFVLFFTKDEAPAALQHKPKRTSGELRIAFINSDSLWAQYLFVIDKKEELAAIESQFQNQYDYERKKFEADYEAYIRKGSAGQLSLAQQKETEALLGEQQKRLMSLDEELSTKFVEQKSIMNQMLLDTILQFIHRYNQQTAYDFIFEYGQVSGLFYANDSLDITENVVNGLNFEYRKWR